MIKIGAQRFGLPFVQLPPLSQGQQGGHIIHRIGGGRGGNVAGRGGGGQGGHGRWLGRWGAGFGRDGRLLHRGGKLRHQLIGQIKILFGNAIHLGKSFVEQPLVPDGLGRVFGFVPRLIPFQRGWPHHAHIPKLAGEGGHRQPAAVRQQRLQRRRFLGSQRPNLLRQIELRQHLGQFFDTSGLVGTC